MRDNIRTQHVNKLSKNFYYIFLNESFQENKNHWISEANCSWCLEYQISISKDKVPSMAC